MRVTSSQPQITEPLVRDLLSHLYDSAYIQDHALLPLLLHKRLPDPLARAQHLRQLIVQAIHDLQPSTPLPTASREWRPYRILVHRYLEGMSDRAIQQELCISERQFFRDLKRGISLLTNLLRSRYGGHAGPNAAPEAGALAATVQHMGVFLERVELNGLLQEVLRLLDPLARRSCSSVQWQPGPAAVAIVDPALARQALISALSLALQHTAGALSARIVSEGETIAICLEFDRPAPAAPLRSAAPDIAERLERIQWLLCQQGGLLQEHEVGTKVFLALRWRRYEEQPILIVDDNPGMLRLYCRYLAGHGYRVITSSEGTDAVRLAIEHKVRLVVLDVMMRHTDGWMVLQQLKAEPATSDIPVLVCSVINEPELARALGAAAFLRKPVTRAELVEAVSDLVSL